MLNFSHELPQIGHELIKKFFLSFESALALFLVSLYAENVFLYLFPKRSGFLFSLH